MQDRTDTGQALRALYDNSGGVASIFSSKVSDYLASRPDYPPAMFNTFEHAGLLEPSAVIADIGSGTGLLTAALLDRGHTVFAVEPNTDMRLAADTLLSRYGSRYHSVDGSAEKMPLPTASVNLITAAQAFHWFEIEATRKEFMRILKPEGQVALIWNDRALEDPLHIALDKILDQFGGTKRKALAAHEERAQVPAFFNAAPTTQWHWPHQQWLDEAGLQSLIFSRSYMPERHSPEGEQARSMIRQLIEALAVSGKVCVRYETTAIVGRPGKLTRASAGIRP